MLCDADKHDLHGGILQSSRRCSEKHGSDWPHDTSFNKNVPTKYTTQIRRVVIVYIYNLYTAILELYYYRN